MRINNNNTLIFRIQYVYLHSAGRNCDFRIMKNRKSSSQNKLFSSIVLNTYRNFVFFNR